MGNQMNGTVPTLAMTGSVNESAALKANETIDLAYLYADPIVKKADNNQFKAVGVPLDLDAEYQ